MVKKENDFRDAKVGDKVTCMFKGFGEILKIQENDDHPVIVKINSDNTEIAYSCEGKYFKGDLSPSLFKGHVNIEIKTTPVLPDLKEGDVIEVFDEDDDKYLMYFFKFEQNGEIITYRYYNENHGYSVLKIIPPSNFIRKI